MTYTEKANKRGKKHTEKRKTTVQSSYTISDQLETVGDATYAYDEDGYLASKITSEGTTHYSYGTLGELRSVVTPDGTVIEYVHNANNQRVAKMVNGAVTEKYLWASLTTLLAVYDGSDNLLERFEYTDGRMPYKMTRNGQTYYLAYDQVGTLKAVSTEDGTIVKSIEYDTFGNVLSDSDDTFKVPFGFAGGLYDEDTKLTRFGYRDYDAEIGKWTAKDPIGFNGGDTNLYGYVLGDPVNFVDPYGLDRTLSQSLTLLWQLLQNGTISNNVYQAYCGLMYQGIPAMWQNTPWYARLPLLHAGGILALGGASVGYTAYSAYVANPMPVIYFIQGFQSTNNWNLTNRAQNYGQLARRIFDWIVN